LKSARFKPVQFLAPHRFHLATVVSNVLQEEDYESRSSTSVLERIPREKTKKFLKTLTSLPKVSSEMKVHAATVLQKFN
jgi:hypothetical protein